MIRVELKPDLPTILWYSGGSANSTDKLPSLYIFPFLKRREDGGITFGQLYHPYSG